MSSLTHCSHVFLLRPRPLVPSTTNPLQASTLWRSRCPNHLNLPRLTTSATQLIPRRLHKSSLRFLSFKDTPHILASHHHTLCPFQTSQVISLHCPRFSSIPFSSILQHTFFKYPNVYFGKDCMCNDFIGFAQILLLRLDTTFLPLSLLTSLPLWPSHSSLPYPSGPLTPHFLTPLTPHFLTPLARSLLTFLTLSLFTFLPLTPHFLTPHSSLSYPSLLTFLPLTPHYSLPHSSLSYPHEGLHQFYDVVWQADNTRAIFVWWGWFGWLCNRHRTKAIAVWPWNMPCVQERNDQRRVTNKCRRSWTVQMMITMASDWPGKWFVGDSGEV